MLFKYVNVTLWKYNLSNSYSSESSVLFRFLIITRARDSSIITGGRAFLSGLAEQASERIQRNCTGLSMIISLFLFFVYFSISASFFDKITVQLHTCHIATLRNLSIDNDRAAV